MARFLFTPLMPWKLKVLRRHFGERPFHVLDVGAGNHSPRLFRQWLPQCRYSGLDRTRSYSLDDNDFRLMEQFIELDLNSLDFSAIPEGTFDALVLAHVIEHLPDGDRVIEGLLPKLTPGGVIYIEYPAFPSTRLPSLPMSLNFFDDPTHCRLYSLPELYNLLLRHQFRIVRGGTRRDWVRIFLTPAFAVRAILQHGHLTGGVFWDLCGFAEYLLAQRPE